MHSHQEARAEAELGRPLNRRDRRAYEAALRRESKQQPKVLTQCDIPEKYLGVDGLTEAWRNQKFLVQVFDQGGAMIRMSVNRTEAGPNGRWKDGISWDELQQCKREIGRGHLEGFEVYPAESEVVNVANMRHIWIFKSGALPFGFNRKTSGEVPSPRGSLPSETVAPM